MKRIRLSKNRLTIKGLDDDDAYFRETLKDFKGRQWINADSAIDNTVGIRQPATSYFYKVEHKKTSITLHATHGVLTSDAYNLSKRHVSTAYLVPRSGPIYELFDPKYWSYHLGSSGSGSWWSNTKESQSTIAIELSNIGGLKPHHTKPDILLDAWGFPYCMRSDEDFYIECDDYRGYKFYATYTDEQYKNLDSLLLRLCREFDILHAFINIDARLDLCERRPKAGILSHVNYRADKVDVSPAFQWDRISGR